MLIKFDLPGEISGKGFPVTIWLDDGSNRRLLKGCLPTIPPQLDKAYTAWHDAYLKLNSVQQRITPHSGTTANASPAKVDALAEDVKHEFNHWLSSGDRQWRQVERDLVQALPPVTDNQQIRVLLETEDPRLQCYPWQEWDLLAKNLQGAEIALSTAGRPLKRQPSSGRVRILVVIGSCNAMKDLSKDLAAIAQLQQQGATITLLEQPTPTALLTTLREQSYEIFVFTGQSGTHANGRVSWIELCKSADPAQSGSCRLQITDLRQALAKAIHHHLQICIFNTCDGLGLAYQLTQLHLPVVIVMREPVPDDVAIRFVRIFLDSFSCNSLFTAFRAAQQQLERFAGYHSISWLPTLIVGNEAEPPTWQSLSGATQTSLADKPPPAKLRDWSNVRTVLLRSTGGVLLAAFTGIGANLIIQSFSPQTPLLVSSPAVSSAKTFREVATQTNIPFGTWRYGGSTV